ncbi:MAG: hypothetical protein DRP63_10060, partial [Planctomycetota bacterium]
TVKARSVLRWSCHHACAIFCALWRASCISFLAAVIAQTPARIAAARKELQDARHNAQKIAKAWWQLHLNKERAFTVWVITAPKKCWSFMKRLFKMGERALLYERLKE